MMLLSNWDAKDRRDVARGSNTAIFEHRVGRWPRIHHEARYLLTDWGGAMGKWGSTIVTRGRWDVDGFEAQTPQFVTGVVDGRVAFGYTGQRTADIAGDIQVAHARWFHGYASRNHRTTAGRGPAGQRRDRRGGEPLCWRDRRAHQPARASAR